MRRESIARRIASTGGTSRLVKHAGPDDTRERRGEVEVEVEVEKVHRRSRPQPSDFRRFKQGDEL